MHPLYKLKSTPLCICYGPPFRPWTQLDQTVTICDHVIRLCRLSVHASMSGQRGFVFILVPPIKPKRAGGSVSNSVRVAPHKVKPSPQFMGFAARSALLRFYPVCLGGLCRPRFGSSDNQSNQNRIDYNKKNA